MPASTCDSFIMTLEDCGTEYEVAVEFEVESYTGDRKQTELTPIALNSADSQHLPPGLYERHEKEVNNACWDYLHRKHNPVYA